MVNSRVMVGYEVLIAVNMKSTIFWFVMLCTSERDQHFGRTYHLHLQGFKVSKARNQQKQAARWHTGSAFHLILLVSCLAYSSTAKMVAICSSKTLGCF
jgi:hypothetical protein